MLGINEQEVYDYLSVRDWVVKLKENHPNYLRRCLGDGLNGTFKQIACLNSNCTIWESDHDEIIESDLIIDGWNKGGYYKADNYTVFNGLNIKNMTISRSQYGTIIFNDCNIDNLEIYMLSAKSVIFVNCKNIKYRIRHSDIKIILQKNIKELHSNIEYSYVDRFLNKDIEALYPMYRTNTFNEWLMDNIHIKANYNNIIFYNVSNIHKRNSTIEVNSHTHKYTEDIENYNSFRGIGRENDFTVSNLKAYFGTESLKKLDGEK